MTTGWMESRGPAGTAPKAWRASIALRLVSLTPFAFALVISLVSRRFFDPLFAEAPTVLGIPVGLVVGGGALMWAALGALVVWTARSPLLAMLALLLFTVPSILALILGPALILIVQNLG